MHYTSFPYQKSSFVATEFIFINHISCWSHSINKRIGEQMNLHIELDDSAKALIVDKGYDEKYGARPLKRALQTLVEDELAEQILEGRIKNGDNVHITCADDGDKKLIFSTN